MKLLFLWLFCSEAWIVRTNIPRVLWGKRIMLNGPQTGNSNQSPFDGIGHITSVVFKQNEAVISEVIIPEEKNEVRFPISDYFERNYITMIRKLPYVLCKSKTVQSGTRNTAVVRFNNQYYAVEESCTPVKLKYDENDELYYDGKSKSIPRMAAHQPDNYSTFSYVYGSDYPLTLNNSFVIPWKPKTFPFLMHDCKRTSDMKYYVWPIMSSGIGRVKEYFKEIIRMPIDQYTSKSGWLIYDEENNTCQEIMMDEYADIFHISHIDKVDDNIYKLYASFVYNFAGWLTGIDELDIKFKEVTLDLKTNDIVDVLDTGINMDFLHKQGDTVIGSSLDNYPSVIKYNLKTKTHLKLYLPGNTVREIVPYDDYLLYFSHEKHRSCLNIARQADGEVVTSIKIPHRLPGFHATLFS